MTETLRPLGDRILVEIIDEEEQTIGGIIIPDNVREKPQRGTVISVGPGGLNEKSERVPVDVAVGDTVVFSKYGGTEVKLGLDDFLILRESDVLGVLLGE